MSKELLIAGIINASINIAAAQNHSTDFLFPATLDGKCGYINQTGDWVIEPQFLNAWLFNSNGLAMVQTKKGYGYINTSGSYVIEPRFTFAYDFDQYGLAVIEVNRKCGLIDTTGKIIVPPLYYNLFVNSGVIFATLNKRWGILDRNGNLIHRLNVNGVKQEHY